MKPHEKLLDDLGRVKALFQQPDFKGRFDMRDWVHGHVYPEKNYWGTEACLGGWLQLVGQHGFKHAFDALSIYGMRGSEVDALFFAWEPDTVQDITAKLAEAEAIAKKIKARNP